MAEYTFREVIAQAMSEEMRKDQSIYLMGEEVAEYNGAYKASKGMLAEFGPEELSIHRLLSLVSQVSL
jgi:pyruvate dehydrogenase E1 component beta subunit